MELPPELSRLFRREREIARIIYVNRSATAKQLERLLSDPITNAAIRSMLARLVRKGILVREKREGSAEFLYRPAIDPAGSLETAVRQLANDFFDGSLEQAAATAVQLARKLAPAGD